MEVLDTATTSPSHFSHVLVTTKSSSRLTNGHSTNLSSNSNHNKLMTLPVISHSNKLSSSANSLPSSSTDASSHHNHHDYHQTTCISGQANQITNHHHNHDHGSLFVNRHKNSSNLNGSNFGSSNITEHERRCFIHLDSINAINSINGQSDDKIVSTSNHNRIDRVLLSPTDFLSLSEEIGSTHNGLLRSSAVRKDVNLSTTSCIEIIRSRQDCSSFTSVSLDRYCESPFMMDTSNLVLGSRRGEVHLSSDDEDMDESTNGRRSRLSEPPTDDMSADELFGSSLVDGGHSGLTASSVVGDGACSESSRNTPIGHSFSRRSETVFEPVCILSTNHGQLHSSLNYHHSQHIIKEEKMDTDTEEALTEELVEEEVDLMVREASPSLVGQRFKETMASLSPLGRPQDIDQLPDSTVTNSSSPVSTSPAPAEQAQMTSISINSNNSSQLRPSVVTTTPNQLVHHVAPSQLVKGTTIMTGHQPLDIKILPAGLLQLAANLAAVFPANGVQKQIAIQLLREDGTSIIVPITTRGSPATTTLSATHAHADSSTSSVSSSTVSGLSGLSGITIKVEPGTNERITATANGSSSATHNGQRTLSSDGSSSSSNSATSGNHSSSSNNSSSDSSAERPFKCELCNSTFTRLGNYTRHKKIHSLPSKQQEDQRFRCDICGKSFIQRCDLARHLHIHRGTEPHRCPQCGKGYIRHSDLVTHQRFHNKEKPFACPHCSKGFCQRGDLNRHLRSIHLQLKPILCAHCHKKFAKEETLLRHINATHRDKATTISTTNSSASAPAAAATITTTTATVLMPSAVNVVTTLAATAAVTVAAPQAVGALETKCQ